MVRAQQHSPTAVQKFAVFAHKRLAQLNRAIEEAGYEQSMWSDLEKSAVSHSFHLFMIKTRHALGARIAEATSEAEVLTEALLHLKVCRKCEGYGERRVIISQDESMYMPCLDCDSTGVEK